MMNAAYLFRELRDQAIDPEKIKLYDALNRLAQNVEKLGQKIEDVERRIRSS